MHKSMDHLKHTFAVLVVFATLLLGAIHSNADTLKPVALRCEYRVNPLGIDEAQPRLTWRVESGERGQTQTAFEILVATKPELLQPGSADLWDSGEVTGDKTANVYYAGKPLISREQCFWKVCVWDKNTHPQWSDTASWTMGLLQAEDWTAHYIATPDSAPVFTDTKSLFLPPARQYRTAFTVPKQITRATIYATALGIYELYVNGKRVGDARLAPGWTDYHQRAYYNTYDVTPLVRTGANAVGASLADGWYAGYIGFGLLTGNGTEHTGRATYGQTPSLMAQLEIEYSDGSRDVIPTDASWKVTSDGPVREGDLLMGETYDARQEMPGWAAPGFADSSWKSAILAEDAGAVPATFYEDVNGTNGAGPSKQGHPIDLGFHRPPKLEAFPGLAVRPIQEIKSVAITSPTNGVYIFNLGQNFAGVARLKVKGPAGTKIRLRYGEMLYPDGRLMTENLRKARATDTYIVRGDKKGETFTPEFTFHGFQYVEVTGYPGKPGRDAITGIALHSDTPLTSDFECSDPVPNRLFKNVVWTQRANFVDLPTDCPQRDERFGWMGDAQIYAHCATLNADVAAFYTKWLREVMEAQRPSGTFPGYCPFPFQTGWDFGTAWCDAGIICPWTIWQGYDDKRIIERCWPQMTKFMDWRKATSTNYLGIDHGNGWGDWLSFGTKTPIEFVDTVYFAYTAHLMSQMAAATGKTSEADAYAELFENIKAAFQKKYLKPDGSLEVDNETAYALALYMDLLPADVRAESGKLLADKLHAGRTADNSGMTTGFLGTRPLLPVLTSVGQNDLAVNLFQCRKFPSWGYEVEQGATTIWERWNGYTKDHGFHDPGMSSFAHYSFGAVCEWMINDLAGIQSDGPGYDKIIIHPHPPTSGSDAENKPINWVSAHYDSIHGRIVANWKRTATRFELETTVPANTSATVYLPAASADAITESGHTLDNDEGVKLLRMQDGWAVMEIKSGAYKFVSKL
jgi:alpha-L-rhamnosidase